MIAILDYGLGNIKAFENIYKRAKIPCIIAKEESQLNEATRLILPGVGSYDQAMELLEKSGLKEKMLSLVLEEKVPLLGICIGMHIMGNSSEEGYKEGLGLIPGEVKLIPHGSEPIPHMGWNSVNFHDTTEKSFLSTIPNQSEFYFLHSYYFQPSEDQSTIASVNYSQEFPCIIRKENIFGIQFHPEKSHEFGEKILITFAGDLSC